MTERRRIFLAGASGAIGSRLVPRLAGAGHEVVGLSRSPAKAEQVRALGAEAVIGDALDREWLTRAVDEARPDVIVHQLTAIAAEGTSPRKMGEMMAPTNRLRREGTANLVATAAGRPVIAQSISFATVHDGASVLDETAPLDTGATDAWGEIARAVASLEEQVTGAGGTVLRYGGFYGPGTVYAPGGLLDGLARKRRLPIVGGGAGISSFVHVDDAAAAVLVALDGPVGIYNIVDDDPAPAAEWIPAFAREIGAPPPRRIPAWLGRLAAGEAAVRQMTTQRGASNAKARAELGWTPDRPTWRAGFQASDPAAQATRTRASPGVY